MEGKCLFDVGLKISNKRRLSGSILNKNLKRYVSLQTAFLHFVGIAIQEGILEEELGHPWLDCSCSTLAVRAYAYA